MMEQDPNPNPENVGPDRWARIIFWGLILYGLGLLVMVIEDALSHTFI